MFWLECLTEHNPEHPNVWLSYQTVLEKCTKNLMYNLGSKVDIITEPTLHKQFKRVYNMGRKAKKNFNLPIERKNIKFPIFYS